MWLAGSNRAPIGTTTDHISPCVAAHSTRLVASSTKPGDSAESACETARHVMVNRKTRRRGQCAVARTSGTVAITLTNA